MNKTVYGIYSTLKKIIVNNGQQEKIIDSNGEVVDNPNYQIKKG